MISLLLFLIILSIVLVFFLAYKFVFTPLIRGAVDLGCIGSYIKRVSWAPDSASASRDACKLLLQKEEVTLSVVVPAYNEEDRIRPMLEETLSFLESRPKPFSYEVIVVDDGSSDKTYETVMSMKRPLIRYVQLKRNMGKGFAVKVGTLAARGELILMVDADAATKFSDLTRLEEKLSKSDIVFGSRSHLQDEAIATRAWYRNLLMVIFHFLVSIVVQTKIRDTQCGFKLFRRKAAQCIFPSLHIARWAFDIEIVVLAQNLSLTVEEVAVNWHEVDGSKLNVLQASLEMVRDILAIKFMYGLKIWRPI